MKPPILVNKNKYDYEVSITRPNKFGNPYCIGVHGTREEVIALFETYARATFSREDILSLENTFIGCVCHPMPCHGDVLIKLFEEYSQ